MAAGATESIRAFIMAKSWLVAVVALLCTFSGDALVVMSGRGCAPGQFPGPGSPPCSKAYHGSGHFQATPAPGKFALPTPNPAGVLYPGCMCPIPFHALAPPPAPAPPALVIPPPPMRDGEVEVLTVDVRLANRIRCENKTVAEEVAKMLKIPVKRITIEPWSWALPSPPQSNYVAFVQEDHERCDCEGEHGQGFRKMNSATAGYSTSLGPGTSVMTVSQFNALNAGSACADGLKVTPISHFDCPSSSAIAGTPKCNGAAAGDVCLGDGQCGTDLNLNNCGVYDIYRKAQKVACADGLALTPIASNECPASGSIAKCDQVSAGALCDGAGECGTDVDLDNCGARDIYRKGPAARTYKAKTPVSRVQMLTRDPCLVYLLREMTEHFKQKIAFNLGVPENKVILDPPPVQGTVGLLQLDTTVSSTKDATQHHRQVPVLGVQQCNLIELGEIVQHLALVKQAAAAAPAAAPLAAGVPAAAQPTYTLAAVNGSNGTNGTNGTNVSQSRVALVMKLHNIDYDLLAASWPLVSSFTSVIKQAIGVSGHIPAAAVKMALFPGSVVIEATITPPPETAPEAVFSFLNGTVCNATLESLNVMVGLQNATTGPLECSVASLTVEDPPFATEETNRPWISLWSVVLEEPFAQEGAWRLLKLMNQPMSELSKLLPMTLARIPGLKYRGLAEPNKAIKDATETRLPPPADKAVGFGLADPYDKKVALEAEMKRMKEEQALATKKAKDSADMEQMKAQSSLATAKQTQMFIKQANKQFIKAARVHAEAIRAPNATKGPDIVPYDVTIEDAHLFPESPYPWRDQSPRPGYLTDVSLAQGKAKAKKSP